MAIANANATTSALKTNATKPERDCSKPKTVWEQLAQYCTRTKIARQPKLLHRTLAAFNSAAVCKCYIRPTTAPGKRRRKCVRGRRDVQKTWNTTKTAENGVLGCVRPAAFDARFWIRSASTPPMNATPARHGNATNPVNRANPTLGRGNEASTIAPRNKILKKRSTPPTLALPTEMAKKNKRLEPALSTSNLLPLPEWLTVTGSAMFPKKTPN